MPLQIGDNCPIFSLENQEGKIINMTDFIGQKILVIYFYPKDDTSGCTKEACSFRDSHEAFKDLGCEVFGISSDSASSHLKFATKNRLTFNLLADTKQEVRNTFGVPRSLFGLISGRVTYIIDLKGEIRGIYNSMTDTEGHITKALDLVKTVQSNK